MLTITRQQFEAFSRDREQGLSARAAAHLRKQHPGWCDGRSDDALVTHVSAAMAFAREHGVSREANVLRLLDLQVRPGFSVPLPSYLHYRLTQHGFDETTRVRNFAFALTLPQWPVIVALDTDLDALDHGDD
jgi:hypothetical protein